VCWFKKKHIALIAALSVRSLSHTVRTRCVNKAMRLAQHGNSIEQERSKRPKDEIYFTLGAVKAAPCRAIKKVGVR
jgi:hypothetical protein